MTQQGKELLPCDSKFSWCWWFQGEVTLRGSHWWEVQQTPAHGSDAWASPALQGKTAAAPWYCSVFHLQTGFHFPMQLLCGIGAKGGLSFPRDSWIKQWGKGVLRAHCSQHLMGTHRVTTNGINLLIAALPPDKKLLPSASLTHSRLGHPSHLRPQQKLQSSCPSTWQPLRQDNNSESGAWMQPPHPCTHQIDQQD